MNGRAETEADEGFATKRLLSDLREANEQLVVETLRAQDAADVTNGELRTEQFRLQRIVAAQREANETLARSARVADARSELAEVARANAERILGELEGRERELMAVAESREQLLGMIAHDLRNPLNGLCISATMLLRQGALSLADQTLVARIQTTGKRMARMVARLFDFTQARLGTRWPLATSLTDVGHIATLAVGELLPGAPIAILVDVTGDLTTLCDADRLTDALSNLVGNAIDYAAPGSTVCVYGRDRGGRIVLEVTNEGAAIPESALPFIFEPFRRAPGQAAAKGDHLGLGLYIAHEVAVAHGGSLVARSNGGTTTFTLSFPRVAI